MRHNPVKAKIRSRQPSFGTGIRWPSPDLAELCGFLGFEWLFVDVEHGQFDLKDLAHVARACEASGIVPIARIPKTREPEQILAYMETGMMGVITPHVESRADVEFVVRAVKFPPLGARSGGLVRPARWGIGVSSLAYAEAANRETMVIALVETEEGLRNLPEILAAEELDGVVIGYGDLALKMGVESKKHPRLAEMSRVARQQILASGKALQVTVQDGDEAREEVRGGALLVRCSSQEVFARASQQWLAAARG